MTKKTVYKVYRVYDSIKELKGKKFPYAEIYSDGSFKCVDELEKKEGTATEMEKEWEWEIASYVPPMLFLKKGGYDNPEYPSAFAALVVIMRQTPPYKKNSGYVVEYFGGGAPWERVERGEKP